MMKKRLFSLILTLVMTVSVFPVGALAVEAQEEEETPAFDAAVYLQESKNKMWININDPTLISCTGDSTKGIIPLCKVGSLKGIYKPYRQPEEILTEDYGYSIEEAKQILAGNFTSDRIRYVRSAKDLKPMGVTLYSDTVFVLMNDITLQEDQYVDYHLAYAFIAPKPYVISMEFSERETFQGSRYATGLCFGNSKVDPLPSGSKLVFSNVILDGNNRNDPLGVIACSAENPIALEKPVVVEGACVINGEAESPLSWGSQIRASGTVNYLGCTLVGYGVGISAGCIGKISIQDCNLYTCNPERPTVDIYNLKENELGTSYKITNSFLSGGARIGCKINSRDEFIAGKVDICVENSVLTNINDLWGSEISVKNSLIQWQDLSRFEAKGWEFRYYNFGRKSPGVLNVFGLKRIDLENVNFDSAIVSVYPADNADGNLPLSVKNCKLVWKMPELWERLEEIKQNEETLSRVINFEWYADFLKFYLYDDTVTMEPQGLPAGIVMSRNAARDITANIQNVEISGYPVGVAFHSDTTIRNSNIHSNLFGIFDKAQYKSGIENSAKIISSQICGNSIAGIFADNAEVFLSDASIVGNGNDEQAGSGGLVFILSEEPEWWDEYYEENSGDYNVPRRVDVINSTFTGNVSATNGGAIRIEDPSIPVSVTGTEFKDNTAVNSGGAISLSDYSKLTVDDQTVFQGNMAQAAYYPPENAGTLYPNLQFSSTSVCSHPLNNYDINYVGTEARVIASAPELEEMRVRYGASADEMLEKLQRDRFTTGVVFDHSKLNDEDLAFPVIWRSEDSDYNGMTHGTYLVYGEIDLSGKSGMENPRQILARVPVTVDPDPDKIIQSVDPQTIEVPQNIYLAPVEKENGFGTPTVASLPETAAVRLPEDQTADLPVRWDTKNFDPSVPGEQTVFGDVLCEGEYREYTNPEKYRAELRIIVLPREYILWQAAPTEASVALLPGAELEEINRQLTQEGKNELAVDAFDMTTDFEVWTFCSFSLKGENNPQWEQQKDIPGTYDLTASFPENFFLLSEEEPGPVTVHVTVREPLEIIAVKDEEIEEYQSVDPAHFDNLPQQVTATLEDGQEVPVDVEWDWSGYHKNTASDQTVIGRLVNLPSKAKQPEGTPFTGNLIVHVIPVEYEITERLTDNFYEPKAALTLAEITASENLDQTFEITSITDGINLTTEYTAPVILEEARNPDFDPKLADAYVLLGTVGLPGNIHPESYPTYEEILLDTQPVDVIGLEKKIIFAREGTAFADIPNKPETLIATLDVTSPLTGEQKTEIVSVDWGNGEGYDPYPLSSENDGPVTESVMGTVVNKQQYLGQVREAPVLEIKIAREYDIESISPARIPETGAMDVNLGSSLEEIYAQLETHTVQLNLRSTSGELTTEEASFLLRAEDNTEYDPLELGEQTLKGFLSVNDPIKNPNSLFVQIVVNTKKYTITTTKVARVTGVISGTEFEAIPMPEEVEVARSDGAAEQVAVASWDGSKYNPTKIGTQVVSGTLVSPLPPHLENPDNRQPKAFVTVVNPTAKILSMEQVREEPTGIRKARARVEEIPGYVEYRYKVTLLLEDGTVTEEMISLYGSID